MRRILGLAFLFALAIVAVPLPAAADTSDFTFDSFDADYTLTRLDDGTSQIAVVETIVARFPESDQNRGIVRAIPDDYDGVDLRTQVASVVDENGVAVPFDQQRTGGFVELALGTDEFVHGAVTYVISYTQQNVVRSFEDTAADEFYWDVNGVGWDQPFGSVSATVHVDPSLIESLSGRSACYTGAQGDTTSCVIQDSAPDFAASAQNLAPRETLTVSIGFAADTFLTPDPVIPDTAPKPIPVGVQLLSGGIGLLSLGGLVLAIVARVRASRGEPGRGTIIPEYSEPDDITIMLAAHLADRGFTAVPAAIVRLAVRHNIRILAYAVTPAGEPYTLQYLGDAGTNVEDQAMLRLLFGSDPEVGALQPFGPGEVHLMEELAKLSTSAKSGLEVMGFQNKPRDRATGVWVIVGQIALGILAMGVLAVSAVNYNDVSGWLGLSIVVGIAGLIASIVLASRPKTLTRKGAEAREYLLGMKMYLTLAEQDRLRALQSPRGADRVNVGDNLEMIKLYEKLLPWAVLWGVEDQWMKELAVRVESLDTAPDWFIGANGFSAPLFSSTIRGFSTAMAPPVSSWTGSGGGGFSGGSFTGGSFGGGFSGGGGGGGGGGGR